MAVDDIAFVSADAVIRPATATLDPTTPALRRLEQIGGPAFSNQLQVRQELAVGAAVVTSGGDLPAEFVIHAIIRSVSEPVSAQGVRRALTSSLQRAVDWELARLVVPLLGIGAGALPLEEAVEILCEVLLQHVRSAPYPTDVCIVVEREEERLMVQASLERKR